MSKKRSRVYRFIRLIERTAKAFGDWYDEFRDDMDKEEEDERREDEEDEQEQPHKVEPSNPFQRGSE